MKHRMGERERERGGGLEAERRTDRKTDKQTLKNTKKIKIVKKQSDAGREKVGDTQRRKGRINRVER